VALPVRILKGDDLLFMFPFVVSADLVMPRESPMPLCPQVFLVMLLSVCFCRFNFVSNYSSFLAGCTYLGGRCFLNRTFAPRPAPDLAQGN
jgi:hypothetical protein